MVQVSPRTDNYFSTIYNFYFRPSSFYYFPPRLTPNLLVIVAFLHLQKHQPKKRTPLAFHHASNFKHTTNDHHDWRCAHKDPTHVGPESGPLFLRDQRDVEHSRQHVAHEDTRHGTNESQDGGEHIAGEHRHKNSQSQEYDGYQCRITGHSGKISGWTSYLCTSVV